MRKNVLKAAVQVGLVLLFAGCDKASESVGSDAAVPIVSVDGSVLTKGELDARVKLMLRLSKRANPQMPVEKYVLLSNQLATTYPKLYVGRTILKHYADREKIEIPEAMLEKYRKLSLHKVRYLRARDYAEVKRKLGADAELFDRQVCEEALVEAVKEHVISANPTNLPSDFVERKLAEIKAYNKRMDATNAVVYARAMEVWHKLKSGEPFGKIAEQYTELEEERIDRGEWGLLDRKMLEDFPKLLKAVMGLRVGEFTEPIEGDNGLLIVRLDDKDEEKEEFTLSRIYFQLPMFALESSAAELVADEKAQHGERIWVETFKRLEKEAKVDYFGSVDTGVKNDKNDKKEKEK